MSKETSKVCRNCGATIAFCGCDKPQFDRTRRAFMKGIAAVAATALASTVAIGRVPKAIKLHPQQYTHLAKMPPPLKLPPPVTMIHYDTYTFKWGAYPVMSAAEFKELLAKHKLS